MDNQISNNQPFFPELEETAEKHWQLFSMKAEKCIDCDIGSLNAAQMQTVKMMLGLSDFVYEQLCRHPHWLTEMLSVSSTSLINRNTYFDEIKQLLEHVTDIEDAQRQLRLYRNRQMVRLAWQDYTNATTIEASLLDLSALAESVVIAARDWLYNQMCKRYGTPMNHQGQAQPLLILGMGKLGGRELNFSSDIDLIFTFPEHGETTGTKKAIENQAFFIRMGQKLLNLLDQVTQEGFVYRVDMRLRPYGESGPLVVSFSALEDYYQEQGRDWERYAMIKARALGPWTAYSDELHSMLRPFVYRRYIDFSAIESLRNMKQLIVSEVRRRKLENNIKLGAGGIREVEFVVQSFQLIRGGREPSLRQQSLFETLKILQELGSIDDKGINELKKSYCLLRRIENILQAINDQQTQTLPHNAIDWERICYILGFKNNNELKQAIHHAMQLIHQHFSATVGGKEDKSPSENWTVSLWHELGDEQAKNLLVSHGIDDEKLWPKLASWRQHVLKKSIGPRGRDTLDKLMPNLLSELFKRSQPCEAFVPVSTVLDQILTRTTYLELLAENPHAREQLIQLCYVSPWIARQLSRFPMLLDELIDPTQLYKITSMDNYPSELRQFLLRVPTDDLELQMEVLRQFKLSQQLKIAAADVTDVLPVMQVSDHLTLLAEAIIEQVVIQAWDQITKRYGSPDHLVNGNLGFGVVGYGKLGGAELGYGSDLDLVFLHNAPANGNTNGDKSIGSAHFYLKLAQRILHLFSTRTVSGELYEVDMRLRPSGSSGLLVSSIENFGFYQQNEAWTWEHQAIVRARFIFGDKDIDDEFKDARKKVLIQPRDKKTLAVEVNDMRVKMREHLLTAKVDLFDLKQGFGGITDIEFLVQYLVLANSANYSKLIAYSDNIQILNLLSKLGIVAKADVKQLINIYCLLRDKSNTLVLLEQKAEVPLAEIQFEVDPIAKIYQHFFK